MAVGTARQTSATARPAAATAPADPAVTAPAAAATGDGDRLPPEFFTDPDPAAGATHAANAGLRATGCPVHPINYPPGGEAYVVSDYETARQGFADPRLSKSVDNMDEFPRDGGVALLTPTNSPTPPPPTRANCPAWLPTTRRTSSTPPVPRAAPRAWSYRTATSSP